MRQSDVFPRARKYEEREANDMSVVTDGTHWRGGGRRRGTAIKWGGINYFSHCDVRLVYRRAHL